jgi:putative transposase
MAKILSLKEGSTVFCGTVEYKVIGPAGPTTVKVSNAINGEIRILSIWDVSSGSADEEKIPSTPLDCLSPEDQAIALGRFAVIKPAILNSLTRKEIEKLAEQHGVHYTTIYRMIKEYDKTKSPASLLPKTRNRGGKGKHRIEPAVDDLIRNHFDDIVKARLVDITKISVKTLHTDIKDKCTSLGFKPPTWTTVADRLEKFFLEKKLERRRGRRKKHRNITAGGYFPDANWPLDVVQIDHTPLNIILVDEENRQPIGRAILSLAICVFSRMVLGFCISLDSPSIFSVGQLIAHCILPKDSFLERVGVNAKWDAFGVMRTLFMDNAGEFRAEDFIPFQEEYMVEISWRPVASPEYGGHIERLAKTLNHRIHGEPGSTFSNIEERGDYDSEGNACYTIDEIERWFTILVLKEYHEQKHSELGMSPREKYEIGILGDDKMFGIGIPDIVEDQERLKLFLLPSFYRTVQREGIELEKVQYFHDVLRNWVGKKDKNGKPLKYLIKRDPRRISPIYLYDPEQKEYFKIPYRDLTRPPMSFWELDASKKRCKEKGINDPNEQQIFQAHAERLQIREESVAKTKRARRERESEKRRSINAPVSIGIVNTPPAAANTPSVSTDDISSLYDDTSLLDGVIVKKSPMEE